MSDNKLSDATKEFILKLLNVGAKNKIGFSKIVFLLIFGMTLGVVVISIIMMWELNNLDPLQWLIPAVFAECAVVSGFYSYKAKSENEIKLETQRRLIQWLLELEEKEIQEEYIPEEEEEDSDELE